MRIPRPPKGYFNEADAARELGLTLDQFRSLVRTHLLDDDEDLANLSRIYFQPSDLVVLRLLAAGRHPGACAAVR